MSFLEIKNIHKNFGKTEVLKGINFSMEKGEVVSVLGSSGSGKTTLLRCLNFLETADKGEIYADGEKIFDAASNEKLTNEMLKKRQLNFGLVFQNFNLFPQYTAKENLMLAPMILMKENPEYKNNKSVLAANIEMQAEEILTRVGLADRMNNYPYQLSGGQQQRVSIARALMLKPKILFFDEPTSALDPELTGEILKVIRSLAEEHTTMIIVTHEIEFAKNVSDKIIFMDGGVIAEYGAAKEVIDNPKNERTKSFLSKML